MNNGIAVFAAIFAAALLTLQQSPENAALPVLLGLSFLILIAALLTKKKYGLIAVSLVALALSVSWHIFSRETNKIPGWFFEDSVNITARVTDYSYQNSKGTGVVVRAALESVNGTRLKKKQNLLLYIDDKSASFTPGGILKLSANLEKPVNTKDFPAFTYYKSRYVDIIGFSGPDYSYTKSRKPAMRYLPVYAAHVFTEQIAKLFPGDSAGFIQALITGDRRELDYGFDEDMRVTGLSHAIAVSGMHISFLSALIILIVGKRRAPFFAVPIMIFFALMVGSVSSVLRAVIMQTAFFAAVLLKRENDSLNALMLSLILILMINPYSVSDTGLWLSFSSTLGIVLFSGRIKGYFQRKTGTSNALLHRAVSGAASALDMTVCATVFTIPVLMMSVKSVSLISPVSNMLTLFLIGIMFMLGLCAVLISFIWFAPGQLIAVFIVFIYRVFEFIVTKLAEIPFASVYTGNAYIIALAAYLYALLVIFLADTKRVAGKKYYIRGISLALALTLIVMIPPAGNRGGLEVSVLDVGQGLCVAAHFGGHNVFIDCGGKNAGEIAYRYLRERNRREADALILTHLHEDHINGCERLLAKAKIKSMYIPGKYRDTEEGEFLAETARENGTEVFYVSNDIKIGFDEMSVNLYYLSGADTGNETGIVALIKLFDFETLVTGDIGKDSEKKLVSERNLPDVEAYVAGHHGGGNSSSLELLNRVLPELTVVSAGENYYGHPSPEAINRFNLFKTEIKRTDIHGNVVFCSDDF